MEDILKGTLLLGAGLAIIFFALKFGTSSGGWDDETTTYLVCDSLSESTDKPLSIKLNVDAERWIINGETVIVWAAGEAKSIVREDQLTITENTISLDNEYKVLKWECMDCEPVITKESWSVDRVTRRLSYAKETSEEKISIEYQCKEVERL
jgi:hypothetical protein